MNVFWRDAIALSRAAKRAGTGRDGVRMLRTDAFILLAMFRVRTHALRYRIPIVNRLLRQIQMIIGGVELGNDITLGEGVYFIHSLGTVVGSGARIGARVRFLGNNTVGAAHDDGAPTIGDDVEIGCGARILGPVHIGAGAVIGANAVVLTDIPADHVAVGAPARAIPKRGARTTSSAVVPTPAHSMADESFVGVGFHPPLRTVA
jgi:serine O-acetyltransferase